jgi:serine/threonine-protein kinase RsbT
MPDAVLKEMPVENTISVEINIDSDIVVARQKSRELAKKINFSSSELAGIAAAISELARNIVSYADHGKVTVSLINESGHQGISIIVEDTGPGITDVKLALQDGYSTSGSLGLGLPGVKRLMDDFEIQSTIGKGTIIKLKKWVIS